MLIVLYFFKFPYIFFTIYSYVFSLLSHSLFCISFAMFDACDCVATIQAGNVFQIGLATESVGPAAKSADVGAQQSCQLNGEPSEYTNTNHNETAL